VYNGPGAADSAWEHEAGSVQVRKSSEHAFGTVKGWMGATPFLIKSRKTTAAIRRVVTPVAM
jgi:hypothetical protein